MRTTASASYSVIMPLYNKGAHVERAIRSAQREAEGFDVEIVVLDDGSTDDGPAVVAAMAAADPRIRLHAQPNGGEGAARNAAIARARGEILALLDCDDEWLPGHLAAIDALVRAHPEAGLYGTAFEIQEIDGTVSPAPGTDAADGSDGASAGGSDGGSAGGIVRYFRLCGAGGTPITTSSIALRRAAFDAVGGFRESQTIGADRILWFSIARHWPVAISPAVGMRYRRDADNRLMRRWSHASALAVARSLDALLEEPDLPEPLRAEIRSAREFEERILFNDCWEFGETRAALGHLGAYLRARGLREALPLLAKLLIPPAVYARLRTAIRRRRARARSR